MRIKNIFLLSLLFYFVSFSQGHGLTNQSALLPLTLRGFGGFGGPQFKFISVNGQGAMVGGGPIEVVFRPNLKGLVSFNYIEGDADGIKLWYFGAGVEYTLLAGSRFEFNLNSQIGLGKAIQEQLAQNQTTTMFIFEPEINAGIRIMEFEKIKIGLGYRAAFTYQSVGDLTTKNLSGLNGSVYLAYGIFDVNKRNEYLAKDKAKVYLSGTYSIKFTRLNGQFAILDGGGTRLFVNRKLGIGIGGYRTLNRVDYKGNDFSIVYGGTWIYYPVNMLNVVHLSFSGLLGFGGVGYIRKSDQKLVGKGMPLLDTDVFVNVNVTEFMQIGFGLGYRLAFTSFEDVKMSSISGFNRTLQVRFGAF
ncbi:MAG: hypothetical protein ACETVX_03240 [bacterium]